MYNYMTKVFGVIKMDPRLNELKIKILLCFYRLDKAESTVTSISERLGIPKYETSRAVGSMEKDGLVDRTNIRSPELTGEGERLAARYSRRYDLAKHHLMYEGVEERFAKDDAFYMALSCSDETFEVIKCMEEKFLLREHFARIKNFTGEEFCEAINDGRYQLPFIIYREKVKKQNNVSMANSGFIHPCELAVYDGRGVIGLKACEMREKSRLNGIEMKGRINSLKYYDGRNFVDCKHDGGDFFLPVECFNFKTIGAGSGVVLHGSICLKMKCSVGEVHMPESTAIFTVIVS